MEAGGRGERSRLEDGWSGKKASEKVGCRRAAAGAEEERAAGAGRSGPVWSPLHCWRLAKSAHPRVSVVAGQRGCVSGHTVQ